MLSFDGFSVVTFLFWLSLSGCLLPIVLFVLSCPCCPVSAVLSRLYCHRCPAPAVLPLLSFPDGPSRGRISCLGCPPRLSGLVRTYVLLRFPVLARQGDGRILDWRKVHYWIEGRKNIGQDLILDRRTHNFYNSMQNRIQYIEFLESWCQSWIFKRSTTDWAGGQLNIWP